MDLSVPFTKAEMLEQLANALLLFVRSTSWVLGGDAAYRLMGWPVGASGGVLLTPDATSFSKVAQDEGQELDLAKFAAYRTFADLYDYGVLGIAQSPVLPIEDGTEATFAMAFVFDCANSKLLFDMQGGGTVELHHCLQTARMSIARQVLDGGRRSFVQYEADTLDELLTLPEVALLANMEEGSVRNAASGKRTAESLRTVTRAGKRYVTPEQARRWLAARRGFRATQSRGHLVAIDLRDRAFLGAWEVAEFLRQWAHAQSLTLEELAARIGVPSGPDPVESRLFDLDVLCDPDIAARLARLIDVDAALLGLRLGECRTAETLATFRRSIERLTSPN